MMLVDYINRNEKAFLRMAAAGVVSYKLLLYRDINVWHVEHGSSARATAEHFGMPISTIAYANNKMCQQIRTEDLI